MTKEIEALETLDEFEDGSYAAYLEYVDLKDKCIGEPTTLFIKDNHEFYSEWSYYANSDGLEIKVIKGDTRIC